LNWSDLEKALTAEHKQVIDISDAALATEKDGGVALRINGLLNYTMYHELFLRAEKLTISRTDAGEVTVAELMALGQGIGMHWSARKTQSPWTVPGARHEGN